MFVCEHVVRGIDSMRCGVIIPCCSCILIRHLFIFCYGKWHLAAAIDKPRLQDSWLFQIQKLASSSRLP